jgi:poly(3-hydroxybutyrate) depolymerase
MRHAFVLCALLVGCGSVGPTDVLRGDAGGVGSADGGPDVDAGRVTDAGFEDAGQHDGGASPDAGAPTDGGGLVDAGTTDGGVRPAPTGCVTSVAAGSHEFTCDGIRWDVEVTPRCAQGGCGLVVDVHGLTMNADSLEKSTKLRAVGAPLGYVIAQPTAPRGALGPSWTPATDDPKVWAAMNDLRRALAIDPKRVHMTGFSQGGAMTWRFTCRHADELASVAPIASADAQTLSSNSPPFRLDCPFTATERPSRALPVLQMHGTLDGLVPIAKGEQQRDAALAAWQLASSAVIGSSADYTHTRYTGPNGLVFEYLVHSWVAPTPSVPVPIRGHCIPGGADLRAGAPLTQTMFFSCQPPNAFVWGEVVMAFFVAHPAP